MTMYHISYCMQVMGEPHFFNDVIHIYPLQWQAENPQERLIAWNVIPKYMEHDVEKWNYAKQSKERDRIARLMRTDLQ